MLPAGDREQEHPLFLRSKMIAFCQGRLKDKHKPLLWMIVVVVTCYLQNIDYGDPPAAGTAICNILVPRKPIHFI